MCLLVPYVCHSYEGRIRSAVRYEAALKRLIVKFIVIGNVIISDRTAFGRLLRDMTIVRRKLIKTLNKTEI